MGAGNTVYTGLLQGKQGILSSGLRRTLVVTKAGRIRYLTRFNAGLARYTKPMARYWLARNLSSYRSIGRFGLWAGVGLSALNVALAENPRARWQAGFAGVFGAIGGALGAWGGSFVAPVAGTITGGMAGAAFGDYLGEKIGGWYYDTFIDKR